MTNLIIMAEIKEYMDYPGLSYYDEKLKAYIDNAALMKLAEVDKHGTILSANMINKGADGGVYVDLDETERFIAHSIASLFNHYYIPVAENIYLKTEWPKKDGLYYFSDVLEFLLTKPITEYDYLEIYGITDDGYKTYVKLINPTVGENFTLYNVFHNGTNIFFKSRTFTFSTENIIGTLHITWGSRNYMSGLYYTNGTTHNFAGVSNPPSTELFRLTITRIDGIKSLGAI